MKKSGYPPIYVILAWYFGGMFGLHHFIVGRPLSGALMLITLGGGGIWWIVDFVLILTNHFKDGNGDIISVLTPRDL